MSSPPKLDLRTKFLTRGRRCVLVLFVNTDDDPIDAPAESRAERHLRLLQELAEIGMDIARAVRAEALAVADDDAAAPAPSRFGKSDPGLVFSRIARAVRQTIGIPGTGYPVPYLYIQSVEAIEDPDKTRDKKQRATLGSPER
jgi:hypothetical protein